jgi:hypothetical protein
MATDAAKMINDLFDQGEMTLKDSPTTGLQ